jgi:hypothetical protein
MEKKLNDFQKQSRQCGDLSRDIQSDTFDSPRDLLFFWQIEMNEAPDILRKSVERFLIGNVI